MQGIGVRSIFLRGAGVVTRKRGFLKKNTGGGVWSARAGVGIEAINRAWPGWVQRSHFL